MAYPASAAQPALTFTSVSSIVSGIPAAVPVIAPKLGRMSLRTMPVDVSVFGPFVPSPG